MVILPRAWILDKGQMYLTPKDFLCFYTTSHFIRDTRPAKCPGISVSLQKWRVISRQRVRQLAVQPCLHGHLHVWFHFKRGLKPHTRAAAANLKKHISLNKRRPR